MSKYAVDSLLSGEGGCGGGGGSQAVEVGPAVQLPAEQDGLQGRIRHLDHSIQLDILEMSEIMAGHPVRGYISEDGLSSGIICEREWMHEYWSIYRRFAECFFRSHVEICTVFEEELKTVGRRHGR